MSVPPRRATPTTPRRCRRGCATLHRPGQAVEPLSTCSSNLNTHIHRSLTYVAPRRARRAAPARQPCRPRHRLLPRLRGADDGSRAITGASARASSPATSRWAKASMAPPMPGPKSTSPARAGTASIPPTTSVPAASIFRSRWPASRTRPRRCPAAWAGDANAFERMEVSVQVVHVGRRSSGTDTAD